MRFTTEILSTGPRPSPGRRLLGAAFLAVLVGAAPQTGPRPGIVRVRLDTSAGQILLALDARRAPATTANFLKYVDDGRFDGTTFYRASRQAKVPGQGFIQGGIRQDARRILPSFPLEPTSRTGIRHLDATVSMARGDSPASAGGNFVITVGAAPQMDARPGFQGYAAFGRAVAGTDTVKRILAMPSGGGWGVFKGQMILKPVQLIRAVRLDGKPQPTGEPRIWTWMPR